MGLLSTAAKAAVASSVHGRVQRRQQMRWAHQDAQAAQQGAAPTDPFSVSDLKATFSSTSSSVPPAQPHPGAEPQASPTPQASPEGAADLQAQLALIGQLNDLRQAGALSDAEFEAKKAQILQL